MKAGRELDALVAEKVMGWTARHEVRYSEGIPWTYSYWVDKDGKNVNQWHFVPSENISDAWKVVEKLRDEVAFLDILPAADHYIVKIQSAHGTDYVEAETAPLAICKAALKAKGVNKK